MADTLVRHANANASIRQGRARSARGAGPATMRIAVVGGAGHVGLPLSLLLAKKGFQVTVIDQDTRKIDVLQRGQFPFAEEGGPELLRQLKAPAVTFSTEHQAVTEADVIILTVATPIDEHLNPDLKPVHQVIDQLRPFLRNGHILLLRSTLFPGTSERIQALLRASGLEVSVSFCPERIAQGKALQELEILPQIISASDERGLAAARTIFTTLTSQVIELSLKEAELAKLFSNAWRYIKFAVANQFYTLAVEKGLDFYRIREAMIRNYGRAADLPTAGFAAGPCLLKDTMQLAAYSRQHFQLGYSAMLVNETLPEFLVEQAKLAHTLAGMRVGLLGMAFKADSDDKRESLSYKLRKLLIAEGAVVLCTDPYVRDPDFVPLQEVLSTCSLLFIGAPHTCYRGLSFDGHHVIDCWDLVPRKE